MEVVDGKYDVEVLVGYEVLELVGYEGELCGKYWGCGEGCWFRG